MLGQNDEKWGKLYYVTCNLRKTKSFAFKCCLKYEPSNYRTVNAGSIHHLKIARIITWKSKYYNLLLRLVHIMIQASLAISSTQSDVQSASYQSSK